MKSISPFRSLACAFALFSSSSAFAVTAYWTDWQTGSAATGIADGVITTPTATVSVHYSNTLGYSFLQNGISGDLTNYYSYASLGTDITKSPYTSTGPNGNSNDPTPSEMVALNRAGTQTLTFSQTIANPYFSYVSLNGNGYAFDQDFDILSFTDGVNDAGYWGAGDSYKNIVTLPDGSVEYQLLSHGGEPHGTIRFTGAFDEVSWRSLSNENWNGFTVGIQGTDREVNPPTGVPDSGETLALLGIGLSGMVWFKKSLARK